MLVLEAHNTTSPLTAELVVLVVGLQEGLAEGLEIGVVLLVHISDGQAGGGLHVAELAEVGLAADEAEGNFLLTAESGQVDDSLDGVDVVGNDDQLGLVLLNKSGNVVETELDEHGLGAGLGVLGLSGGLEALLLVLSALSGVLGEQLEELVGLVLVKGRVELGNGRRDLKALHEDGLLSLDTDVARPLDHAGKIALGLDVTTNTEVAGALLEKGILGFATGGSTTNNSLLAFNGTTSQIGRAHV